MKIQKNVLLDFIIRWTLALVFIYAAAGKILKPDGFVHDIDNYRLLPYLIVSVMAVNLPWIELCCGFLLIFGKWLRGATLILIVLNIVFIFAISSALVRGLDINCGCFSLLESGSRVGLVRIVEDIVLLGMSLWVFVRAGVPEAKLSLNAAGN
ncbi:DoxX family membrane protein [candidate division KSB1 bacterium]|nr:DoxX family membrane protein [candidate division KSB1 bacterium]